MNNYLGVVILLAAIWACISAMVDLMRLLISNKRKRKNKTAKRTKVKSNKRKIGKGIILVKYKTTSIINEGRSQDNCWNKSVQEITEKMLRSIIVGTPLKEVTTGVRRALQKAE